MAKKKRRRAARSGVDPNEARRLRLEARRQAKAEEQAKRRRAARLRRAINRALALVLIAGIAWFIFFRSARPDAIAGHSLEHYSESAGTPPHVATTVSYEMTPPVSGQHDSSTIPCGTYATQPQNELLVHNLEHGVVALLFDPESADRADIRQLESIARDAESHVLSAPYAGMRTPIAVTSWGEMMRLDDLDLPAVREYLDTFLNKGPEKIDCPNTSTATFRPEPEATPSPSPSPSPSPTGGGQGG